MLGLIPEHPRIFWALAAAVTAYYGIRGVIISLRAVAEEENKTSAQKDKTSAERGKTAERENIPWPRWQRIYVNHIHQFMLNAVRSLSGFGALFLASEVYSRLAHGENTEAGTAVLFGFLVLVAITGITGILPEMLYRGGLFGHKS